MLAYCLWHQLQKCGFVVILPTVAEYVCGLTMESETVDNDDDDDDCIDCLLRFDGGNDLPI